MEVWRVLLDAGPIPHCAATLRCRTCASQPCTHVDHLHGSLALHAIPCPVDWLLRSGPQPLARLQ